MLHKLIASLYDPCASLFFTVTKQRDPETGQQSLLFQVSVFGWNVNLIC